MRSFPWPALRRYFNRETKETSFEDVVLEKDEGNRPSTTLESLQGLEPVFKDGQFIQQGNHITAGNASQLSDGASACVVMEGKLAEQRGLQPLGIYRAWLWLAVPRTKWASVRVCDT